MVMCKKCGKPIEFKRKKNGVGRWMPINTDGTPHFATCGRAPRPLPERCPHCKSDNLESRPDENGIHPGKLICMECERWIKWLSTEDYQKFTGVLTPPRD